MDECAVCLSRLCLVVDSHQEYQAARAKQQNRLSLASRLGKHRYIQLYCMHTTRNEQRQNGRKCRGTRGSKDRPSKILCREICAARKAAEEPLVDLLSPVSEAVAAQVPGLVASTAELLQSCCNKR